MITIIVVLSCLGIVASGADEIAFIAEEGASYYTDSMGTDPSTLIGYWTGEAFDLSPDGNYIIDVYSSVKSYGTSYGLTMSNRWDYLPKWGNIHDNDDPYQSWKYVFYQGSSDTPRIYSPRWSPDGTKILLFADIQPSEPPELIVVDPFSDIRRGIILQEISTEAKYGTYKYCDWAPDGQFIYSESGEMWITDGDFSQSLGEGRSPDVSPDETKVAFLIAPGYTGSSPTDLEIWVMDMDGSNRKLVHQFRGYVPLQEFRISWSPDSREVAFITIREIKAVSLDGIVRDIIDFPEYINSIAWSPSGDKTTRVSPATWGEVKSK